VIDCTRFGPFHLCCRGIKSICPSAGGVSLFTAIAHYLLKRIWKDARGADPNISQASPTRNVELSWDDYCNSTCRYNQMFTTTMHTCIKEQQIFLRLSLWFTLVHTASHQFDQLVGSSNIEHMTQRVKIVAVYPCNYLVG